MSKYKKVTIEDINEILGFDITEDTRDTRVVRARQGAWLCFYINGHSYKDIAKMFGFARSTVIEGVDMFERLLKEGDKLTLELWQKLKVYEL
jgi:chromosomal replication initiation ATPase DnaA